MTFTELGAAVLILALFFAGLSSAAAPAARLYAGSCRSLREARELSFVIESFRAECRSGDADFAEWKRAVSVVDGVKGIEISALETGDGTGAWRLSCEAYGVPLEVLAAGACE